MTKAGLITIGTGTAMENAKMVTEDVVEEHNGVYGGKWHIVSPEGFDLPEGLEYLKNSWEGNNQKYKANIVVKNLPLKFALEELYLMMYKAERWKCVVEISDDGERGAEPNFYRMGITGFLDEFIIHRCHITFEDIRGMFFRGIPNGICYHFSDNTFVTKDFHIIEELGRYFATGELDKDCIALLDLRRCNFSAGEKDILREKLRHCNLMI